MRRNRSRLTALVFGLVGGAFGLGVVRWFLQCACRRGWGWILDRVDRLSVVRNRCPALRVVYLPDATWPLVRAQALATPDAVGHRSFLLYALDRGCLNKLTRPIHHFILDGQRVRSDITTAYLGALREQWMLKPTEVRRHVASKQFFGKVAELQVAEWLSARGWRVIDLEARGAPVDLIAESPDDGSRWGIEVKRIGQDDPQFEMILQSLQGPAGGPLPVYAPPNYLQFRAYEAAKQLQAVPLRRLVVIVIDQTTWHSFQLALDHHWIDWHNAAFLGAEPGWEAFIVKAERRQPNLRAELRPMLRTIDSLWIVRQTYDFEFLVEVQVNPRDGVA